MQGLYGRVVQDFSEIAGLPLALREQLAQSFSDLESEARLVEVSGQEGKTRKMLLELGDGEVIEAVLIPMRRRGGGESASGQVTLCLSCQAGCAFGCAFCASGKRGLIRNLTTGEIVAQAVHATRLLGVRPGNLVYMGIGEPLANYESVLQSIRLLNSPESLEIGARRITVSTCGLVPEIRRLAGEGLQIELSVSLHASNDMQRSAIMPVNRRWPLPDLIAACHDYTAATKRIITFEYTLIGGFNDSPDDVAGLIELLQGLACRINLIPLSSIEEFNGEAPPYHVQEAFRRALIQGGINTTLRRSRGAQYNAACGQLRLHRRR